jgi:carbamoyl-phosphate synthase large subunit
VSRSLIAPTNVLITAASRRVPLVQAFRRALTHLGGGVVIVTDVNPLSPAVYASERAYRVPLCSEPSYIEELLTICRAERIGMVIPTIDNELTLFGQETARFAAAGVRVVVSPVETTTLCNDKYATCRALTSAGVAAAPSYLPVEIPSEPVFPLFLKPRYGRGGVGAHQIRNRAELLFFLGYVEEPIVQEYLEGPEFTIDMLCDFSGRPLSIVPRERVVIRAGVIDRGRTVKDPRLLELAAACADALRFIGPINIQCRVVNGHPVVFEINPRFSGGIPLTIEAGADFPRMLLELNAGRQLVPAIGRFRDNLWMSSYEASVFLDGDAVRLDRFTAPPAVADVA